MRLHRRTILLCSSAGKGLSSLGTLGLWTKTAKDTAEPIRFDESPSTLPIGLDLVGIADWEQGFPFKNLFLGARPWLTRSIRERGPLSTKAHEFFGFDKQGYPLEVPVSVPGMELPQAIFTIVPKVRSPGRYILLHDGEGEIAGLLGIKVVRRAPSKVVLVMRHAGNAPCKSVGRTPQNERSAGAWSMEPGGVDVVSPTGYAGPSKKHYRKWAALGARLIPDTVIEDMMGSCIRSDGAESCQR